MVCGPMNDVSQTSWFSATLGRQLTQEIIDSIISPRFGDPRRDHSSTQISA
jgi:hypothetical protein